MAESLDDLKIRIRELEKEVALWKSRVKDVRYGLNWLEIPEAFDRESEDKIPILEEVRAKAVDAEGILVKTPPHILIEGDNYHALTCLNYTHRGKVDVIYIDPPYNTGSDGFTYKDKRFLTEYPDGQKVPKDHPLRHSYWLSFMEKRLKLAKNLLSEKGVMFISIDNNEQANLKLLCDKIFGEENFVECFLWNRTATPSALSHKSRKTHEYVLCYQKSDKLEYFVGMENSGGDAPLLNESNKEIVLTFPGKYVKTNLINGTYRKGQKSRLVLLNDVQVQDGLIVNKFSLRGKFRWQQSTLNKEIENNCSLIVKSENFAIRYSRKGSRTVAPPNFLTEALYDTSINKNSHQVDTNEKAGKEIADILGIGIFDYPKPVSLIAYLLSLCGNSSVTILDFFAGSGTTLHAAMKLNAEDGGNRQCILVQQAEGENNICERVTYERNRRVMQGYTNVKGEAIKGFGGHLKYYKTNFVGKHPSEQATDADKVELADKAGCLIALAENTLESVNVPESANGFWQIYSNDEAKKRYTCIYHNGDYERVPEFVEAIDALRGADIKAKFTVYVFSWNSPDFFENEFDDLKNIEIKAIPKPILEIYKALNG